MRILIIFVSLASALVLSIPASAQNAPRIAGFQVNLFNSKTGSFSGDMLAKDAPEMGNVPSGEFASVSVFVVVKVDLGKEAPVPQKMLVRLLATESGAMPFAVKSTKPVKSIILNSTSNLGPVNADGGTFVGFWLTKTGCQTIVLKATIVGAKPENSMTVTLPFACYE
jgi:hypothetical protein